MICAAVTYVIKHGHEEQAAELFRTLTEQTRAEPGCRMYLAHRSTTDPRRFFLYEQYDDQAALDAHRAAPISSSTSRGASSPLPRLAPRNSSSPSPTEPPGTICGQKSHVPRARSAAETASTRGSIAVLNRPSAMIRDYARVEWLSPPTDSGSDVVLCQGVLSYL